MDIIISIIVILPFVLIGNLMLGATVLASIDEDGELFEWAEDNPLRGLGFILFLTFWPIIYYVYKRD